MLAGLGFEKCPAAWRRWLALLAILDLLAFGWRGTVTVDPAVYRQAPPAAAWLRAHAGLERILLAPRTRNDLRMNGGDETKAWLRFKNSLFPNFPTAYGLYAADGQEELRFSRYETVIDRIDRNPLSPWLDVAGIRYVLSVWDMPAKFVFAAKQTTRIFRNPDAFPKAYVAYAAVRIADAELPDYVERTGSRALRETPAVSDADMAVGPCGAARGPQPSVADRLQSVLVDADGPCPGLLVLTDAYDSGWRARVNGVEARVLRVNLVQRGVLIPAGKARVEFFYRPAWLAPLLALSGLSWVAALAALWRGRIPSAAS
jgi:hypothetical protein